MEQKQTITISTTVNVAVETAWEKWTNPADVVQWNFASPDWHSPAATNDLQVGGKFCYRMEAKDGSIGFDFEGIYTEIVQNQKIVYKLGDDRLVYITFENVEGKTVVSETFEIENENAAELQRQGWQAILNNYKAHAESGEF